MGEKGQDISQTTAAAEIGGNDNLRLCGARNARI